MIFQLRYCLASILCIYSLSLQADNPAPIPVENDNIPRDGTVLPYPPPPFKGIIDKTAKTSKPDFPQSTKAPLGAPNVLLILMDDVGFGASSTFGGPIPTPTLDLLAKNGLRYNQFHTTALCSPTRAALLTGRNHHTAGTGNISEFASGYPGYNSIIPKSVGTIANILIENGYNTSWFGKNHLIPDWLESAVGPFDQWPGGLGFEYFYGFLGGDTDQWHPALFEQTKPVLPPFNDPNYILINDLTNRAISWIRLQHVTDPNKPFFLYFAPGNAHAPHHAPKNWIAKFKGQFDQGWDKVREETLARQKKLGIVPENTQLTPRPKEIPAWDSLTSDQKKVYARMMEVYAATLAQADYEIGRILDTLKELGELDNTLIIFIEGDNGASAEGTLQGTTDEVSVQFVEEPFSFILSMYDELGSDKTYNHYPVGWAHAMDSPMQWTKQVASHFGGTRNGMVISWPKRIKKVNEIRSQFQHVTDITPTILEAVGVPAPIMLNGVKQKPMEGTSLIYSFDDPKAPTKHNTQYFEITANRGIYHDGWMANTTPLRLPWITSGSGSDPNPEDFEWELYDIRNDFSQAHNLAKQNPAKLKELQDLFWVEAKKYNVLPLDASFADRADPASRPSVTEGRSDFTYYPGMIRITEGSTPDIKNKSFTLTADVNIPQEGSEGVIATQGGRFAGWALLVLNNKPVFAYRVSNQPRHLYQIKSDEALSPGQHIISFDFKYDGGGVGKGGVGTLFVDEKKVASGHIEQTVAVRFSLDESFDVGQDTGSPVLEDYSSKMPFKFTGDLKKFHIHLGDNNLNKEDRNDLNNQKIKSAGSSD